MKNNKPQTTLLEGRGEENLSCNYPKYSIAVMLHNNIP
jgi:hypothetical protein